jgi:arylsulfatase A-like enzyme
VKDNIILITVDSLRLDRMGYASDRDLTPYIDRLSKEGVSFTNAFSEGPATPFSFPSLFVCGHHPFRDYAIKRTERLVTQELSELDYYTAGFVAYNFYISKYFGYDKGFAYFKDYFGQSEKGAFDADKAGGKSQQTGPGKARKVLQRYLPERLQAYVGYYLKDRLFSSHRDIASSKSGGVLTEEVIHHLKNSSKEPFFLWTHYMDVHSPYIPPQGFKKYSSLKIVNIDRCLREVTVGKRTLTPQLVEQAQILYDQEVRYVDHCIGKLVSFLKQNNIYDDTTIIITSDHGEMFREHFKMGHPTELYDELLRVPLIVKSPHVPQDSVVDYLVSLGQIPSLLNHLSTGQEPEDGALSLLTSIDMEKGVDYVCAKAKHMGNRRLTLDPKNVMGFLDSTPYNLLGLRTKRYKLIFDQEKDSYELYDLKRDSGERKNIFVSERKTAEELKNLMEVLIKKYTHGSEKDRIRMTLRDRDMNSS